MTEEEVVSVTPPSESVPALAAFVILGVIDLALVILAMVGIAGLAPKEWGWDQFTVGKFTAFAFLGFTLLSLIYWKKFMPFILIKKKRRGKKEIADDYYKEINYD